MPELKTPYLQASVVFWSVKSLFLVSLFGGCKNVKPGHKIHFISVFSADMLCFIGHTFMQWCIKHVKVCYI